MKKTGGVRSVLPAALILAMTFFLAGPAFCEGGAVDCDIDRGACTGLVTTGMTARLEITPRPVETMKDLILRVDLKQGAVSVTDAEVSLSFSMPGMTMPENTVSLRHRGGGRYQGSGTIVRCPGGSRLWRADLRVKRLSGSERQSRRVSFSFRLIR